MKTISFSQMLNLLRSGDTVSLEYYSYSASRNEGGDKKSITCRDSRKKSSPNVIQNNKSTIKKVSPYSNDIIIVDMQLMAGTLPIEDGFRKIYPLFVTKINGLQVTMA